MDNELMLISLRDRENPEVEKMFVQLEKNNSILYRFLNDDLQKDPLYGVRRDVFAYVVENAAQFNQNQRYMFNLAGIMCNIKILPEHIKWIDSYLKKKGTYETVDDFMIIFGEAVEKDMPLEQIQNLFDTESDEIVIYDKIVNYQPEANDTVSEKAPLVKNKLESRKLENEIEADNKNNISEKKENHQSQDSNFAEMFHSLITVMNRKDETDDEVHSVDENFKQIVAKFQLATSELMAYASEVVHTLECKNAENERLNALMTIQQRVMSNQQNKINELHIQIAHLNFRIQEAEKTEMKREAINQKICELQNLTINEHKEEYPLFLDDVRR